MWSSIPILSLIVSVFSVIFGIYKYFDQRREEWQLKRFEHFTKLINLASGRNDAGVLLTDVHQAWAIFLLGDYKEYRDYILPVMEYYESMPKDKNRLIIQAVLETKKKIEKNNNR